MKKLLFIIVILVACTVHAQDFYQEFDPLSQNFRFEQTFYGATYQHTNMNLYPYKISGLSFDAVTTSDGYTVNVYHVDCSLSNQIAGAIVETNSMGIETNFYNVITNIVTVRRTNKLFSYAGSNDTPWVKTDVTAWYITTGDELHFETLGAAGSQVYKMQVTK